MLSDVPVIDDRGECHPVSVIPTGRVTVLDEMADTHVQDRREDSRVVGQDVSHAGCRWMGVQARRGMATTRATAGSKTIVMTMPTAGKPEA